jgi:superfamily II DNA or RNA helicase
MKLRQHQIKCINAIQEYFETESNALIKMFCGAGKSFVIFDSLLRHGENYI